MKRKTSISLSDESLESIKKLATAEDRSVSYVIEQFVSAAAQVAEDSAAYGASIKQIADSIKDSAKQVRSEKKK